ncbi:MAG: LacI family DNA-binding transcriptional regulator [Collinsella sp.]|nr:LacI family DNA-binding transcriptional regulator [Collinsella sp.]
MTKQRVTIADVAREAGTSTASVSYYLNDKRDKLSDKTQAKIARVIKELGYVPNAQAQTLTGKQTRVIAIIILDNTNKWAGLVLNGMEQVMLPAGYQTVVCTSNFNPETELMYVDKMLSLGVDGFIIQPTANFKAVHDRIRRAGKPVVFFDAAIYSPGTSWIKTNLYDGVYNATQVLLDAGYEDFWLFGGFCGSFSGFGHALRAKTTMCK